MRRIKMNKVVYAPFVGLIVFMAFFYVSCNTKPSNVVEETTTSGKIKFGVDDSYKLLLDTELYVFTSIYKDAHITPVYKSEVDILNDLLHDSIHFAVLSKKLTKEQEDFLKEKQLVVRYTKIAYDGIALIVNKANKDSLIRYDRVKDILTGKLSNWSELGNKSSLGKIQVVFDNEKSSTVRSIKEKYGLKEFPSSFSAVKSNEEIIEHIKRNKNSIGVLSNNWISDRQDSVSKSILNQVAVVAMSAEYNSDGDDFYGPHQAYLKDKSYPFIREVYVVSRETFTGLGEGFTAFLAGEKGQRIILKSGLLPATMPIRFIQTKKN